MKIGNFNFDNKVFIVAELSANHNGNIKNALETIKAAKRDGADFIFKGFRFLNAECIIIINFVRLIIK